MRFALATSLFLRAALAASFLSAVADRFGIWPADRSVWGHWQAFVDYTQLINPWAGATTARALAITATGLEIILAIGLLLGFRTRACAALSGVLLLLFGLAMAAATGVKAPLDYSVFTASAAAFALSGMQRTGWEMDTLLARG